MERVKTILASKGLTLYQISQRSRSLYGRSSPYFVPHNLYYEFHLGVFSPSLHQVFSLSRISGYRFHDWLRVFGFNPEVIVRLQVLLSSKRTILLDSTLDDPESWIPWFRSKSGSRSVPAIAPIGHSLGWAPPTRIRSLGQDRNHFVYAKVGREDAFAFPYLVPGSIVRANPRLAKVMLRGNGKAPECLFLVEHAQGFRCCRLQVVGKDRVIPLSNQLPYAQVDLQLHEEARILGVLDLEMRSMLKAEHPDVPAELAKHWRPLPLKPEYTKLGQLLRSARLRMGLSFREASAMSRQVVSELGDDQYFAAPGSLSDYEVLDGPPRHIHKAITLCVIYGLHFATFLKSIGLVAEGAGTDPIPDNLVLRKVPTNFGASASRSHDPAANGFLGQLLRRWERVPFFLRESIVSLSGLNHPSLLDFFWVGGDRRPLHPLLVNGLLVIVNRHRKKPIHFRSRPLWQQPVYVLLRRDGTYICGCCSLESGTLVIHPYSPNYQRSEQLRNHDDAEVVGQIVTIARTL